MGEIWKHWVYFFDGSLLRSNFLNIHSRKHCFSAEIMVDRKIISAKIDSSGNQTKLSSEAFTRIVEQAIARIPYEIRSKLDNVLISVQPYPSKNLLEEMGFPPDEELFGIFTGVPLIERNLTDPPLYPDTIFIFQEPLEAFCSSREELIEEIEITVVHEIAHFVGFSDEKLDALGYG